MCCSTIHQHLHYDLHLGI
uniref:Uncharacterized protein n=1 Tax=Anguilla anguilla TaxID=7936 RepID=A0A0E9PI60_ANGAN